MIKTFQKKLNTGKTLVHTIVLLCVFVFAGSSKQNHLWAQDSTNSPDSKNNQPLIFVYLQGYNSCRKIEDRPVTIFRKAAAGNSNSKLYWGCFDGGHITHLQDTKEYFYLFSMDAHGKWSEAEEVEPQSASLQIAHYIHNDIQRFRSNITRDGSQVPKTDVFIAGHSHGGWLAMRVAYQMAFLKDVKLQQLLTIDPISYKLCASHWFPLHVLYNTFNWLGEPDNCHKAPADLEHINPYIAETTDCHWINIYEDSMPYLTSGPIEHATTNIRYEPPTNMDWVTAHRAIMHTDWTWSFFANRVSEIRGLPIKPIQSRPSFDDLNVNELD